MNILQITQEACRRAKEPTLSNLFSDGEQSSEFLGYANQMASKITDDHFWRALIADYSFTTVTPTVQEYDLPTDYDSMLTNYLYDTTRQLYLPNSDDNTSLQQVTLRVNNQDEIGWRIIGNKIKFDFVIEEGRTIIFTYKKKNFAQSVIANPDFDPLLPIDPITNPETITTYTNYFVNNESLFLVNDELLVIGILLQRAVSLGFPEATQRLSEYNDKLTSLIRKDGGLRKTNIFGFDKTNRISPTNYQRYGE